METRKSYITEKKAKAVVEGIYDGDLYAYFADPKTMEYIEDAECALFTNFGETVGYADAIRFVCKRMGYSFSRIAQELNRDLQEA